MYMSNFSLLKLTKFVYFYSTSGMPKHYPILCSYIYVMKSMKSIQGFIIHALEENKEQQMNIFVGGKDIGVIPAALSLTVSFVSSIMIIGWPAEVYTFGGQYFLGGFGFALGYLLCAFIYVPVLYPLKTTTANEVY